MKNEELPKTFLHLLFYQPLFFFPHDALENVSGNFRILFDVQMLGNVEMRNNVQMATQLNFG